MSSPADERRAFLAGILLNRIKASSGILSAALTRSKVLQGKAEKIYRLACDLEEDLERDPGVLESVAISQLTKEKKDAKRREV